MLPIQKLQKIYRLIILQVAILSELLRKRFEDELIGYLLELKWWEWPAKKIFDNLEALCSADLEKIKEIKMSVYSKEELFEAKRQIDSTIHKLTETLKTLESKKILIDINRKVTLAKDESSLLKLR